jgi:hypothetical protein
MDDLVIISKLQRTINDRLQTVVDIICTGGIDSMEKYNYMLGQIRTYQTTLQDISTLLEKKEQKDHDGNVINFGSAED